MRDFVGGKDNVFVLEEGASQKVRKRVVFFVEGECGGVGGAGVGGVSDFLLAIAEEKEFETAGRLVGGAEARAGVEEAGTGRGRSWW